jgi:hypothetical protein
MIDPLPGTVMDAFRKIADMSEQQPSTFDDLR